MFWNAWNLDFKGVNLAVTHFVTQFTHVSRHFRAWKKKINIGIFREICLENMVSEIHKNDLFCPYNPPKIKKKNLLCLFCFFLFSVVFSSCTFSKSSFDDTTAFLWQIWDHKLRTVFPKDFFCFVILNLKCLETFVNGITKCVTAQFYHLEVIFLKI